MDKLIDMKRPKPDKKSGPDSLPVESGGYPWGLNITLEDEELKKLGFKELPDAGEEIYGTFIGKVTRATQSEDERGSDRSVAIQIIQLKCDTEEEQLGEKSTVATEGKEKRSARSPVKPASSVRYGE